MKYDEKALTEVLASWKAWAASLKNMGMKSHSDTVGLCIKDLRACRVRKGRRK